MLPESPVDGYEAVILFVAAPTKEILQNCCALVLQDAGCDIAPVIEARHLEKVDHASRSTGEWICATENDPSDSCVHERACAHRTRLLGYVKVAVGQPPIASGCFSLRQCQHFRVRGSVLEQLHLIMGASDDLA